VTNIGVNLHRTPALKESIIGKKFFHYSAMRMHENRIFLLLVPCLVFLLIFFAFPLFKLLWLSIFTPKFTLDNYIIVFGSNVYLKVLLNSLKIATNCTVLCLLLGYPVAYLLNNVKPSVRNILLAFVVVPYFLSLLVRIYGWYMILGRHGVLNYALISLGVVDQPIRFLFNSIGVHIGMVNMLLPYMILTLFSVMKGIDKDLLKAAQNLGASSTNAFLHVFLPLSLPGIGAGCLSVFILGVGYFVIPALMGGRTDMMISQLISSQVSELMKWEFGAALSFVLLVITSILLLIFNRYLGLDRMWGGEGKRRKSGLRRKRGEESDFPFVAQKNSIRSRMINSYHRTIGDMSSDCLSKTRHYVSILRMFNGARFNDISKFIEGLSISVIRFSFYVFCSIVFLFLAAPILVIIPMSFNSLGYLSFPPEGFSFRWYNNYFSSEKWISATIMSFKVAGFTALIGTLLAIPASISLVRGNFKGKDLANIFIMSPIVIPSIIISIAAYFVFAKLHLIGNMFAISIMHAVITIPLIVIIVSANMKGFDETLERAARNLGAGPLKTFLMITLPILAPGVISAAFFAFMRSFDEVVIALFMSGPSTQTLPMRMWEGFREELDPTIAAVSSLLICFCIVILTVSELLRRRAEKIKMRIP